jgi:hypothetical protein
LLALVGIFIPSLMGIDGFDGGFAISAVCVFVSLTAFVTAIMYWVMARGEKRIQTGDALVHWTYTDEEWSKFVAAEKLADASSKTTILKIIIGFCVLFGIILYIADPESGKFVAMMMAGLAILMTFVAYLSIRSTKKFLKTKAETYISRDGILFGDKFCTWTMAGTKLEKITLHETTDPAIVDFEYSIFMPRQGRQHHNIRVPVPTSERKAVRSMLGEIGAEVFEI